MATSDSDKALAAYYHAEAEAYRKYAAYWRTVDDERMALICDGWAVDDDKQAVVHERDFEAEALSRAELDAADTEAMRLEEAGYPTARREATDETRNGEEQSNE